VHVSGDNIGADSAVDAEVDAVKVVGGVWRDEMALAGTKPI